MIATALRPLMTALRLRAGRRRLNRRQLIKLLSDASRRPNYHQRTFRHTGRKEEAQTGGRPAPEYKRSDFGTLVRGKYAHRALEASNVVVLEPQVAAAWGQTPNFSCPRRLPRQSRLTP